MTKKHYVAIAAGFAAQVESAKTCNCLHNNPDCDCERIRLTQIRNCVAMFCDVAIAHNANFDRNRFFLACGI